MEWSDWNYMPGPVTQLRQTFRPSGSSTFWHALLEPIIHLMPCNGLGFNIKIGHRGRVGKQYLRGYDREIVSISIGLGLVGNVLISNHISMDNLAL